MNCKIYHNPRCKYSREGLSYLKKRTKNIEIREYLKDPITHQEIREILLKSNLKPLQLVRNQEEYFKTYLKGKQFTEEEWIRILVENPRLLKRPIIVNRYRAVVGTPVENIDKILESTIHDS